MKTITEIKAAKQEIIQQAINTSRESRSQAEALSIRMEALAAKAKVWNDKYHAAWTERETLIQQAIACEGIINA